MRGETSEILLFVIFGLVLLFQFVMSFLRKKAAEIRAAQRGESGVELPPSDMRVPSQQTADGLMAQVDLPSRTQMQQFLPQRDAPMPDLQFGRSAARRTRRFSRAALMGDRRAVQDAVVIAAILRPCHAHKPYEAQG